MNIDECIKILHNTQKWRRGGKGACPDTKLYGNAIDFAIRELRKKRKSEQMIDNL